MKTIHVEFTEQEFQALSGLLDAGVKAVGLAGARAAVAILAKLEAGVQAAQQMAQVADEHKPAANGHAEAHA